MAKKNKEITTPAVEEVKVEEVTPAAETVVEVPDIEGAKPDAVFDVTEKTIITLRARQALKPADFAALENRIAEQAKKYNLNLVLLPYSARVEKIQN